MREQFVKEAAKLLITSVVGTILYFVIEKLTTNTLAAVLVAISTVFALSVALVYWYMRMREKAYIDQMNPIGLQRIYDRFDMAPSTTSVIEHAKTTIEFLGISARTFFESEDVEELVKRKVREGVVLRFLVLNPDSQYVKIKANDEGDDPEAWRHDIQASISRINRIKRELNSGRIEVRIYDIAPIWRGIFVDDKIAHITYYPHGHRGKYSPVFFLENREVSLYDPLHDYFKCMWDMNEGRK
jgi:hypothetical protein